MARWLYGGVGAVFVFHRIVPKDQRSSFAENRSLEVTPEDLRYVLDWCRAANLEPIRLDDVPERLNRPRSGKFVAFTFDDGYRDNFTYAAPIFRQYEVPWAVNICPGLIDQTAPVWWYAIEAAIAGHESVEFEWRGEKHTHRTVTQDQLDDTFRALARVVRSVGRAEREDALQAICRPAGVDFYRTNAELIMNWTEVRKLAADPLVTLGCHTYGHHVLKHLTDDEVREELLTARERIQRNSDREIKHLAYPFGGRNAVGEREARIARECDFLTAYSTRMGNLFPAHRSHLQMLPRIGLSGNYSARRRLQQLESGLASAREYGGRRVIVY